jgi:hypothetical protein
VSIEAISVLSSGPTARTVVDPVHVRHLAFQVFKAIKELYQYINGFENKERRGELDQGRG